ncbi:hypothetical protein HDU97_007652 [Phlyctochytrium planicorne]|nr:hypothetical protein HDU97_007652 [Phlyctochytrium planicorne]
MVHLSSMLASVMLVVVGFSSICQGAPTLARRDAINLSPHHLVPSPGSAPIRLKSYAFDPASKSFSGEIWVQNIAFNKIVQVYWSTPTLQWAGTNGLNATWVKMADNGYEIWAFNGVANTIDFGSQFYLKYQVAQSTYWDSNGGPSFNYALENVSVGSPAGSLINGCVGNGIQRKLFTTSGSRYLVIETLSDNVVHFEVSESRRPNPNLKIFNTPMVDEENLASRFCGPTSYTESGNVLETANVKVTIDTASLSATVFDKVKGTVLTTYSYSGLSSGQPNSNSNPPNLVLGWTRELTENVYGIAATPSYDANTFTSDGSWMGRSLSPPGPFQGGAEGYGNTMVNAQQGAMSYAQIPVVYNLGSNGYNHAFFLDDQHRLDWDLTTANHKVTSRGARALRWYAIAGKDLYDLRKTYLKIVGPALVPPKAALGLQISKFGYTNWAGANFEVDGIVSNNIPLDAVIFDLFWFGGFGSFGKISWDPVNFPDPAGNLKALRAKGPGAIVIEEPYVQLDSPTYTFLKGQNALARQANGSPTFMDKWWGKGSYVDHTSSGSVYWATCKRCKLILGCVVPAICPTNLESSGASDYILGHWQDLGEPELFDTNAVYAGVTEDDGFSLTTHRSVANIYQLLKTKRTYELYKNQTLTRRPVSLTRTGTAGIARYGAFTWSGDIPSFAPAAAASFGAKKHLALAGMEFHSSDIGGFHRKGCQGCDIGKLYTSWLASSVWLDLPIRPHVNAFDDYAKSFTASPAAIGDLGSNRFNIRIRYFLMPLYYSLAHSNNRNGEPIITPLFMKYPEDKAVRDFGHQYLVGPIMVPFTMDTNTSGRRVYLPANTEWYNFHTHERVVGTGGYSSEISYYPFKDTTFTLPALVQAGSIFPTAYVDDQTRNTRFQDRKDNTIVNPLQIRVYPGAKSTFVASDDDGETQQYTAGAYTTTELTQELVGSTATITVGAAKGYYLGLNSRRQLIVEIVIPAAFKGVSSVTVDGVAIALNTAATTLNAGVGYKFFGINNRILGIYGSVGSVYSARTVVVNFN